MKKRIFVPLNENAKTIEILQPKHINESAGDKDVVSVEELKDGLNLLILIRDGYATYKDFTACMSIAEENGGTIGVSIVSSERDIYSDVTIHGKGVSDCEAALDYAIEKIVTEEHRKTGVGINESLKNDILSGALGMAIIAFAGGSLNMLKDEEPSKYEQYVVSSEEQQRRIDHAKKRHKEYDFYQSKDWSDMDPQWEGYVYDKIKNERESGGTLMIMVDEPIDKIKDQYSRRRISRLPVNEDDYKRYDIGDYIDVRDVMEGF